MRSITQFVVIGSLFSDKQLDALINSHLTLPKRIRSRSPKAEGPKAELSRYNVCSPENNLACPYFVPREILNDGCWPHPSRLPLGVGWTGNCRASGEERPASETHIRDFCNLGYAAACPHLPPKRDWDAVRFSVAHAGPEQITICFVCELAHAPIEHGELIFDLLSETWINSHPDPRVQTLASCYLQTYRSRRSESAAIV